MSNISKKQQGQRLECLKQKEFYNQIVLETKMRELTILLDAYQITDSTELSTLEIEILPLKRNIDTLLNQLEVINEQALYASHYSEIEFEEIEVNNIPALFTTV